MKSGKERPYKLKAQQLYLSYPGVWWRIIRDNKLHKIYWWRILSISFFVLISQPFQLLQRVLYTYRIRHTNLSQMPIIFVIGHWRSGTTHLHYLFARDRNLSYLSNYQGFMINLAGLGGKWLKKILAPLMPRTRPQDNVKLTVDEPAEEEQPLTNISIRSGMHSFWLPNNQSYFEKYNLFKNISFQEKIGWQKDYDYLLRLIYHLNGKKNLILKNPHNTGRVKELLDSYPNAKFVYIHREPYVVYSSTRHLFRRTIKAQFLQFMSEKELEDLIITNGALTVKKYLQDRTLLNETNLVELSFAELEKNPIEEMQKIYTRLGIPHFEESSESMKEYIESVMGYEKNTFSHLSIREINKLNTEWDFWFKTWGYKKRSIE